MSVLVKHKWISELHDTIQDCNFFPGKRMIMVYELGEHILLGGGPSTGRGHPER